MGRTDDIINVAGHRLSTGGMEEVLASHPDVAECAVLGIKDELKGEVPCGFVVLKAGVTAAPAEIETEVVALVREQIGPVAAFKLAITVGRLPKTRSGKILRGTMKKIADGDDLDHAGDDRRSGGARRDRRRAEGQGVGPGHARVSSPGHGQPGARAASPAVLRSTSSENRFLIPAMRTHSGSSGTTVACGMP